MTATEQDTETAADEVARQAAADVPALFVDGYFLNSWPGHIRIAFGEYLAGKGRYRTAVVLPLEDAESLAADLVVIAKGLRERETGDERETPPKES